MLKRPISPHLQIYKLQWTWTLSILHRLTGMFLMIGFLGLIAFLECAREGEASYIKFQNFITSRPLKILGFCVMGAFFYHLLNGLRHLCWDFGYNFEIRGVEISGKGVVILTSLLLFLSGFWVWGGTYGN